MVHKQMKTKTKITDFLNKSFNVCRYISKSRLCFSMYIYFFLNFICITNTHLNKVLYVVFRLIRIFHLPGFPLFQLSWIIDILLYFLLLKMPLKFVLCLNVQFVTNLCFLSCYSFFYRGKPLKFFAYIRE